MFRNTQDFARHCCICTCARFASHRATYYCILIVSICCFFSIFLILIIYAFALASAVLLLRKFIYFCFWLFLLLLSLRLITNVVVADINDFVIVVLGLTLLASFSLVYRHDFWVHVYLKICSLGAHAPSCRFGNTLGLWQHNHYDFSLMWTNCCGSQYYIRVFCTCIYVCMHVCVLI